MTPIYVPVAKLNSYLLLDQKVMETKILKSIYLESAVPRRDSILEDRQSMSALSRGPAENPSSKFVFVDNEDVLGESLFGF